MDLNKNGKLPVEQKRRRSILESKSKWKSKSKLKPKQMSVLKRASSVMINAFKHFLEENRSSYQRDQTAEIIGDFIKEKETTPPPSPSKFSTTATTTTAELNNSTNSNSWSDIDFTGNSSEVNYAQKGVDDSPENNKTTNGNGVGATTTTTATNYSPTTDNAKVRHNSMLHTHNNTVKILSPIFDCLYFISQTSASRFAQILSVGIGGSTLGPQFVAEALAPDNPPLKIRFIDNTDPAGIDHQIAQLGPELASTLVIVVSKSGDTPETRNGLLEVQKAFREAGLYFAKQGVAITQDNSLLDNTTRIEGWLARFPMFDWVGGRTFEMSAVGLLAAALQGIDIKEMLAGASLMDEANRTPVPWNQVTVGVSMG